MSHDKIVELTIAVVKLTTLIICVNNIQRLSYLMFDITGMTQIAPHSVNFKYQSLCQSD